MGSKGQSSILGFFSKTPTTGLPVLKKEKENETPKLNEASSSKANATPRPAPSTVKSFAKKVVEDAPVVPSSDLPDLRSSQEENRTQEPASEANTVAFSSPSRRVRPKSSISNIRANLSLCRLKRRQSAMLSQVTTTTMISARSLPQEESQGSQLPTATMMTMMHSLQSLHWPWTAVQTTTM